ncbi:MAG: hypothetical protein IPN17_26595 [Deltaproteobacteria bacterium]|nr:hypothetical protein [Deltaproteobacteria bacterium]
MGAAGVFALLWWAQGRERRGLWAWTIPGAVIVAWVLLHRAMTGEWFWFLRENRLYIARAWQELRLHERQPPSLRLAPVWYLAAIPWLSMGPPLLFAIPGLPPVVRRAPRSLALMGLVLLAFVTAVWVARTNLGLMRHFVALIPFYATLVASGITAVAALTARALGRPSMARALALGLCLAVVQHVARGPWRSRCAGRPATPVGSMCRARGGLGAARQPRQAGAGVLRRALAGDLHAAPPWRFIRWRVSDVSDFTLLVEASQRGRVLVVTDPSRATQLRAGVRVLYRDATLVVLRRDAPAVLNPRVVAMPAAD